MIRAPPSNSDSPRSLRIAGAGGSGLSVYLGQSIILSSLLPAYGAGLWAQVDRLAAVALALATGIALIVGLAIWRERFRLGPFEWLFAGSPMPASRHHVRPRAATRQGVR
ncbi:MAG: DUF418 domain-containing protein [Pseudomonadota bacterium]